MHTRCMQPSTSLTRRSGMPGVLQLTLRRRQTSAARLTQAPRKRVSKGKGGGKGKGRGKGMKGKQLYYLTTRRMKTVCESCFQRSLIKPIQLISGRTFPDRQWA